RLGSSDKLLFLKKPFTTIAVKQMAQSLVAKWNLGEESRRYTQKLEQEVQERTRQLQRMLDDLHQKNETLLEVQADLRDTEEKFNVLTKSSNDGIVLMDEGGKVSFWNPAARVMFGYASEEAVGKEIHTLIVPEAYREQFKEGLKDFRQTGPEGVIGKTLELYARQKDGTEIPVEISVSALQVKKAWHTATIIRDISERKKMEQDMTVMAHYDMLTGLPNRSLFFDRFTQFLSLAHRHNHVMAVLYLDLDKFKQINDNYGHDVGDTVLQETAKRLGSGLRKSDTVTRLNARGIDFLNLRESDTVARIGGDEFMILLSQIRERSDSILVAKRTIAVLSRPIHIDDEVFTLGVSVGISLFPDHGTTMDALIKNADIAMYRAKALSGNRYEMFDGRKDTAPAKKPKDGTTNQ
ncbi:MAG: diguanylate cyclase, partial [Desulfuromonadaceae bacterium]